MKIYVILSVLVILFVFLFNQSQGLNRSFKRESTKMIKETMEVQPEYINEQDIQNLPVAVQKYLKYSRVIGKEKVRNVRISAEGQFNMGKGWSSMKVEQYNFFGNLPARFSFMKLKVSSLPVVGLDSYYNGKGKMSGKILGLLPVISGTGTEMDQSELAVFLSEMCTTPASLIDKRITWEPIDDLTVKATFTDRGQTVSGMMYFNKNGELTKFTTEDKLYQKKDKTYKKVAWSVLISDYKELNGQKIGTFTKVVWHFTDGDFVYGKLHLQKQEINSKKFH